MPTYRVEVEHVRVEREVLHVTASDVADAANRARIFEDNGRTARRDTAIADEATERSHRHRVVGVRERAP